MVLIVFFLCKEKLNNLTDQIPYNKKKFDFEIFLHFENCLSLRIFQS